LIQEKLADMPVKTDALALLTYRAAWQHDIGNALREREASIAKIFSSESAQEVVDQALQVFGGCGVVNGAVVESLYRHVRAYRIFDGTSRDTEAHHREGRAQGITMLTDNRIGYQNDERMGF
jgi:acyl-CoA dehydrogenase